MDAINGRLSDEHLKPHVANLIEQIQPTPELKRRYYVSFIDIKLDQRRPIQNREDLLSADIVAGNNVDRIFGSALVVSQRVLDESRVERPQLYAGSTLRNVLGAEADLAEHGSWLDGMTKMLAAIFIGREPPPVEALIRGADHKFYQPVLETVRQRSFDGALVSAHITFHEKVNTRSCGRRATWKPWRPRSDWATGSAGKSSRSFATSRTPPTWPLSSG